MAAVSERSLGVPVVREATAESAMRRLAPCSWAPLQAVTPDLGLPNLLALSKTMGVISTCVEHLSSQLLF